jgi:hypothetical protein
LPAGRQPGLGLRAAAIRPEPALSAVLVAAGQGYDPVVVGPAAGADVTASDKDEWTQLLTGAHVNTRDRNGDIVDALVTVGAK